MGMVNCHGPSRAEHWKPLLPLLLEFVPNPEFPTMLTQPFGSPVHVFVSGCFLSIVVL